MHDHKISSQRSLYFAAVINKWGQMKLSNLEKQGRTYATTSYRLYYHKNNAVFTA